MTQIVLAYLFLLSITASAQNFFMGSFPSPVAGTTLRTNLVGYWAMEAAGGANEPDSTPRGNTLTVHGATVQDSTHIGGSFSLNLNGTGNYEDSASTDLVFGGAGAFSGTLWLYCTSGVFIDATPLITEWNVGHKFVLFEVAAGNTVAFAVRNPGDTASVIATSTVNLGINSWHLIAYGFDPANGVVWIQVDNETRKTASYTGTPPTPSVTTDKFTIGNYSAGTGTGPTNTKLDEAAFWTRTLTASEVSSIWNGGAGTFYAAW